MSPVDDRRRRRLGGWGFEGEAFPPSPQLLAWLEDRIGPPQHPVTPGPNAPPDASVRPVPAIAVEPSADPWDRLAHARGQGLVDVIRLRTGRVPALPDAVLRPAGADEVAAVLGACASAGTRVIPWGGGTSVTGGVNVVAGDAPVISLDLERMAGVHELDAVSGLATVGPGTAGPRLEAELATRGLTLGHYPQSWELATVGGWVATRSSGQESLGYGRIEDMVAGLELVAPHDRLQLPAQPASAAGPDLRQLVMGSEGRLGVITEVTLRVRPRPPWVGVEAALLPDLEDGLEAARELAHSGLPLTMLRLSDAPETQVAMAVGLASSRFAGLARGWLRFRGIGDGACLLLVGSAGDRFDVGEALAAARSISRSHGAVTLGRGPGEHWKRDRFRHPYLRESLLDLGYATDTFETATVWSRAAEVRERIVASISSALETIDEHVAVLCHVSHPYRDGTSLYFTFFIRCADDPDATVERWARVKRAANRALVDCGVTLSHHHGIGQWHAPAYPEEVGPVGRDLIAAAARRLDPDGILNPHVLLDATDRLEA